MEADAEFMAARGHFLPPVAPNSYPMLCSTIFAVMTSWLRTQHVETPDAEIPSIAALREVALQVWSLFQPWMTPAFSQSLLDVFESVLGSESSPRSWNEAR
jgi:hypothetical protein